MLRRLSAAAAVGLALAGQSAAISLKDLVGDKIEIGGASDSLACASFGFTFGDAAASHRSLLGASQGHHQLNATRYLASSGEMVSLFGGPSTHRRRRLSTADAEESAATGCVPRGASLPTDLYIDDSGSVTPARVQAVNVQMENQKMQLVVIETPGSVLVYSSPSDLFTTEEGTYQVTSEALASKIQAAVSEVAEVTLSFPERSCPGSHNRRLAECGGDRRKRKLRSLARMTDME